MSTIVANTAKIFGAVSGVVQGVGQLINARQEIEIGSFNARISEIVKHNETLPPAIF